MGRIWMPGAGGADVSVVTATAEHVLAPKVIVDKDGNPITGSMPDRTGTALTVSTNGQTLIPKGYHDGTQYAKNTQATLAGGTLTPSTSQVTAACSGKLMTSNYVIPAFSLPAAGVIVKGNTVTIYGKSVTGTGGVYPAYSSLNYYGSYATRTASITIGESGTYFIYAGPVDASGDWSIKQGSATLYSGTNVYYSTKKYINSGVVLALTAYVKTALVLIACKYSP